MPRDEHTPICGAAKIECYGKAKEILLRQQMIESLTNKPGDERVLGCNCLPACTFITYDAEISQYTPDWTNLYHSVGRSTNG